jgi:hypothetical protein
LGIGGKGFVVPEIVFRGVVVSAAGDPIANAYIVSKVLPCFLINVPGKLVGLVTGRTGITAVFAVVFFEMVSKCDRGHEIIFCFSFTIYTSFTFLGFLPCYYFTNRAGSVASAALN